MTEPIEGLYVRPGFMIRRAHQIAVAIFLEETGDLRITTTQYGILVLLNNQPALDQISVAKALGLDRSTTGMVIKKLQDDGLVERVVAPFDRRRRSLRLTRAGVRMLARLAAPAEKAQRRLLSALRPGQRKAFLQMLDTLTHTFNNSTRVPLEKPRKAPAKGRGD